MEVTEINRIVSFKQKLWLKRYISRIAKKEQQQLTNSWNSSIVY